MEAGMAFEPTLDPGMFVSAVVVDDEMEIQVERRLDVDELKEPDEFLMAVSRHTIADHLAIEHA